MSTFKPVHSFFMLIILISYSCSTCTNKVKSNEPARRVDTVSTDTSLNGIYTGLEYMGITRDPVDPGKEFKLFHLGYLKIKDDSIFLDQSPVFVYKNDTSYSASDGGFYYYGGIIQKVDTAILLNLKELFCDYCGTPIRKKEDGTQEVIKREKHLKGYLAAGGFTIDGYLYSKTQKKENLVSEHPEPYLEGQ